MSHNELRRHVTAVPFRPFVLHVSDGRMIHVHARDFIMVSPLGSTVDVFQPDETHDILAGGAITGVSFPPPAQAPTGDQQPTSN
ncbi:MAG: hypothetical protein K2P78_03220 [Gemmataceae bacterium]|nr:hypothetical protein [Gemmataceae bacterium]